MTRVLLCAVAALAVGVWWVVATRFLGISLEMQVGALVMFAAYKDIARETP